MVGQEGIRFGRPDHASRRQLLTYWRKIQCELHQLVHVPNSKELFIVVREVNGPCEDESSVLTEVADIVQPDFGSGKEPKFVIKRADPRLPNLQGPSMPHVQFRIGRDRHRMNHFWFSWVEQSA
jgi:hypothetical protein